MRLLISLCVFALVVFAQTDRGTITGTVTDPAGAVVANAPLQLKGAETGTIYQATTSATGNYAFSQLPVGVYQLSVAVPGFKTFVRQNIRVQGAQTVAVNIALEVGAANESVTVSAEVSLLKTESSDVTTNVDTSQLNALPILPIGNGYSSSHGVRNPMAVSSLAPGTYFDPNLNIKVNGAPSNTEAIHVDGQDATNGVVPFSQAEVQPSVDALQELSIQSSNYAAEYGQAGAGLFNYTTKSGTNQFHGSAYDYLANDAFNASEAYTHSTPPIRRNNFGFTIGGPLWFPKIYNGRDRTFFFVSFEGFKEVGSITNQFPTVPTAAYRAGDFSKALSGRPIAGMPADSTGRVALDGQIFDPLSEFLDANGNRVRTPFQNNQIPLTRFDPVAVNLLKLIPNPTLPSLVNNYNDPFRTDRFTDIPSLKMDHSINDKSKLSFYWSTVETAVQYCIPLCGSEGFPTPITATRGTFIEAWTVRVNWDQTLTPTLLLHVGTGFVRNDFKDRSPTTNFDVQGVLGLAGTPTGPNDGARFPVFRNILGGNSTGGLSNLGPAAGQVQAIEQKPTANVSLTWVKDNHTFKFGGELRIDGYIDRTFTRTSGDFSFSAASTANPYFADAGINISGGTTGFPLASLLLGQVDSASIAPFTSLRGGRHYLGFFAQDTWKLTPKLTLDYGLRYDYSTYPKEEHGRVPGFDPTVADPFAGGHPGYAIFEGSAAGHCNCDFAQNYPWALGPRLGLAYQITPKTVLRAGFGISYSASIGGRYAGAPGAVQALQAPAYGDPAFVLSQGVTSQGQPLDYTFPNLQPAFPLPGTVTTPAGFNVFDQNLGRPARQVQWSIGLQREILPNLVVDASYVANRGAWWSTSALTSYNAITPDILSHYGLDITKASDRAILSSQIGSPGAGRFRNMLPYAGFPTTATVAQALRPFPQFGDLVGAGPLGKTWYDSLQATVTKRLSHGLDFSYNFTWSKSLQLGADTNTGVNGAAGGAPINDIFNRDANKSYSSFDRPFWMVLAANYTTPKWGPNRWIKQGISDWTVGAVLQYGSGLPIPVPITALPASNLATALLRPINGAILGTRAQRVAGQPLFLQDLNCHCFDPGQTVVLNSAAWTDPTPGTFSSAAPYYGDYRFQRHPKETMSLGRVFRIKERYSLQIRMELTNVFNRTQTPNPLSGSGGSQGSYLTKTNRAKGVYSSGFGVIPTLPAAAVIGERSGLLVARFQF